MKKKPPYKNGPWTIENKQVVFENPWLEVSDHVVRQPDGSPGEYGVVHFKNRAIGILPLDENGHVPLVGQHRFPLDAYSWELPEGGGPIDENPLAAAKRELAEETGFIAKTWVELCGFDVSNSVTDEVAVCFIAADLTAGEIRPESSEELAHKALAFTILHDLVLKGEIRDSLTIAMVLMAQAKALQGSLPKPICDLILNNGREN